MPPPNAGKESVEHPATSHEHGDLEWADCEPLPSSLTARSAVAIEAALGVGKVLAESPSAT
jgi:hypothetical protein